MIKIKPYLNSIIIHLFIQIILTLISSINWIFLLISFLVYIFLLFNEKNYSDIFYKHYLSSLIFCFIHYLLFTLSYAEILPWETALVIILVIFIIFYQRKLSLITKKTSLNSLLFEKNDEENDWNTNLLIIKCYLANICLFFYTFHLCLTTICTPQMYFNWFLFITNCRYTYARFFSSYTFAGGLLVSLTWTITLLYFLIRLKFR